jgi:hypothetical protein
MVRRPHGRDDGAIVVKRPSGHTMNNVAFVPSVLPRRPGLRSVYLNVLAWAFTLFNTVRVFAYLPTMWAIQQTTDSSQHSLWTWLTWLGANATMAAWLYEKDGRRASGAMWVSCANAAMCTCTVALILVYRF